MASRSRDLRLGQEKCFIIPSTQLNASRNDPLGVLVLLCVCATGSPHLSNLPHDYILCHSQHRVAVNGRRERANHSGLQEKTSWHGLQIFQFRRRHMPIREFLLLPTCRQEWQEKGEVLLEALDSIRSFFF